jgi:hypothetical protein
MLLHFIWINKTQPFAEGEYTSLLSALKNTTYDVRLHTNLKPGQAEHDPYTLLVSYPDRFQIIETIFEEEFEGVRPRLATISDIYRIRILKEHGGAYSDLDILWFKDFPEDLSSCSYAACWENPSYKTVQNAFLYMRKGQEEVDELLEEFSVVLKGMKERGKTDLTQSTHIKDHMLLYHSTANFFKRHCSPMSKKYLFKNGWRRVGRVVKAAGLPRRFMDQDFGDTADKIDFKESCGFHYGNYLFPFSSIKQLPALKEFFKEL